MKSYTVYNNEGRILRSGFCSTAKFKSFPLSPGEKVIEGFSDDRVKKVQDGVIVDKEASEINEIDVRPTGLPGFLESLAPITNLEWTELLLRVKSLEKATEI